MIEIPGGSFIQGNPVDTDGSEGIAKVSLETFFIDSHEVTNEEYFEVFPEKNVRAGAKAHPVSEVTWQEAQNHCRLQGQRLPSESEWEKAARGTDGRLYPWGDKVPKRKPHPFYSGVVKRSVGLNRKDVSFFGVRDMAGSVWEWTADRMDGKIAVRVAVCGITIWISNTAKPSTGF